MLRRYYQYTAVVCLGNGTWRQNRGVFHRDDNGRKPSPGLIPRLALQDCQGDYPAACHIFITETRQRRKEIID